jgi:tRNA-dihydrouridine synthase B
LLHTGADAVMIGRAAQGRPWIFREIEHYLATGRHLPEPSIQEIRSIMLGHLHNLYAFYGESTGVRVARKHISWYSKGQPGGAVFRDRVNRLDTIAEQLALTQEFFARLVDGEELAA